MQKLIGILVLVLQFAFLSGQSDSVTIHTFKDHHGTALLNVKDQLIKNPSGRIIYNVQGNIVFNGTGSRRKDILLMLRTESIFSERAGEIIGQDKYQTYYYTYGGGYYVRASEKTEETVLLAYWQKSDLGNYQLFDGITDSLLARYSDPNADDAVLTALFHNYQISNELATKRIAAYVPPEEEPYDVSATSGTIRRMWSDGQNTFEWDGYVLKKKWGNNPMMEWSFDGLIIRRVWSNGGSDEFIWENNILRRRWVTSPDEFVWNGRTIRRRYGPQQEEYIIQGSTVKSMWSDSDVNQWQVEGDVPIPIIAMVIYGLVY